jgi:hypothetical protein
LGNFFGNLFYKDAGLTGLLTKTTEKFGVVANYEFCRGSGVMGENDYEDEEEADHE